MAPKLLNMQSVQDNPPPGGYPKINMSRGIKPRGPSGAMIWGGILLSSAYGFFIMSYTTERKRDRAREKRSARMAILPYMMAEQDLFREMRADELLRRETETMKNVEGWEIGKSVYHSRWTKPTDSSVPDKIVVTEAAAH